MDRIYTPKVRLVAETVSHISDVPIRTSEQYIVYCARVSSSKTDEEKCNDPSCLIKYCMKHGHWSIFEQVDLTFEITTYICIANQLLRHRSATFQQYSQRYAYVEEILPWEPRWQNPRNRQSSIPIDDCETLERVFNIQNEVNNFLVQKYNELNEMEIAKECSRMILPQSTKTTLYMKNNLRNWLHYINTRNTKSTQAEHRHVAEKIE